MDVISVHTETVTGFLERHDKPLSRFVLLDHMDWMGSHHPIALAKEWEAILASAAPCARILLRSAHHQPAWLDQVRVGSEQHRLRDVLHFEDSQTVAWQAQDRVHTYAGLVVADVPA